MVLYKLVKAEQIYTFERLVTESLAEGWELAGSICVAAILDPHSGKSSDHLIQPMTKAVVKPEAQKYLDSHIGGNNGTG